MQVQSKQVRRCDVITAPQNTCKHLHRGGLVLAEVPQRVKETLDLASLTTLFKIFDTETEAVGSF